MFLFTSRFFRLAVSMAIIAMVLTVGSSFSQSRPQKPDPATSDQKRNQRPKPMTEEERKKAEEEKRRAEEEKNAVFEEGTETVQTSIVRVDAVVYNKKTGQIVEGLKKENFGVFENGVKQEIANFSTPESPITVTVLVEFSKWTETLGSASGGYWEPGTYEAIRPVGQFVSRFIKPPNDYASVVAFDIRPTPIVDFTNDPAKLRQSIDILLKNRPAFRENNLWDALKFVLYGGRSDSVVLENSKERWQQYGGMADLKAPRKAIILVASGIDTFSKINYDEARKLIQEAGVPIYVISTGNMFYKKYEPYLGALDDPGGLGFGRLTFLQAQNAMNTIAKESGGVHYPMTFEGEVPGYLNNINALLRNQYSLSYDLTGDHQPGKKYKLEVKVDVDGDGVYDDKTFVVQHRPFYIPPGKADDNKKKK